MNLEIFQLLAAGGDVATIGLAFLLWKFDRRLYRLELRAGFVKL